MDIHTRVTAPAGRPHVAGSTTYDTSVHDHAGLALEDIGLYVVALRMIDQQGWTSAAELDGESRGLTPDLALGSLERLIEGGFLLQLAESGQLQALPSWARPAVEEYLATTRHLADAASHTSAVFTQAGDPEAHTLQTLSEATNQLLRIREALRAWQHQLEELHDALLSAPDGEPVPDFLAQEAGRFASAVLRLQAVAATRLLDGPFGVTEDSLHVQFEGTALVTRAGRIEPTALQLPSTTSN